MAPVETAPSSCPWGTARASVKGSLLPTDSARRLGGRAPSSSATRTNPRAAAGRRAHRRASAGCTRSWGGRAANPHRLGRLSDLQPGPRALRESNEDGVTFFASQPRRPRRSAFNARAAPCKIQGAPRQRRPPMAFDHCPPSDAAARRPSRRPLGAPRPALGHARPPLGLVPRRPGSCAFGIVQGGTHLDLRRPAATSRGASPRLRHWAAGSRAWFDEPRGWAALGRRRGARRHVPTSIAAVAP